MKDMAQDVYNKKITTTEQEQTEEDKTMRQLPSICHLNGRP